MSTAGTYTEQLPCGGTLQVTIRGFRVQYYFEPADRRRNGTLVNVAGDQILEFITALRENWNEYLELKKAIPTGGSFQRAGRMGMQICIGSYEGVCLQSYHKPIRTEAQLQEIIDSYHYAMKRAAAVQLLLEQLDTQPATDPQGIQAIRI